jgi:hypothetical protein
MESEPGFLFFELRYPVTWPRWSMFASRELRGGGSSSGVTAATHARDDAVRRCPHSHTTNAITTAMASPNQVMAYCM